MQWDRSEFAGFSSTTPWSGVNVEPDYHVAGQEENKSSILHYYRKLLAYKKTPLFTKGSFELIETSDHLYCYERKLGNQTALVCCNLTEQSFVYTDNRFLSETVTVLLSNGDNSLEQQQIRLEPYGSVVLVLGDEKERTEEKRIKII